MKIAKPADRDPVCGMSVDSNTQFRLNHKNHEYLFCSMHCLAKFQKDPDRYAPPKGDNSYPVEPASSVCAPCCQGQEGEQITNCPDCGAPLEYDAERQEWVCNMCGVIYKSDEIF